MIDIYIDLVDKGIRKESEMRNVFEVEAELL
jgi:hypothetical protein